MVFDNGRLAEFDSPHALLQQTQAGGSIFASLIDETGAGSTMLKQAAAAIHEKKIT
jgi:hypothetical protein